MEPKEKVKFLYEGKKVKLKSLDEAEDKNPRITREMQENFGGWVTIRNFSSEEYIFGIKEDCFGYHIDWIDNSYFISLPDELFEI